MRHTTPIVATRWLSVFAAVLVLIQGIAGCATTERSWRATSPDAIDSPAPQTEFRAVWVATVANIDWPSEPGLTAAQQQAEALAILDQAQALNLNAVVLQIRPHGDALYPSEIEPWSSYLTGTQGRDPGYDPLRFWLDESHARGLELHAWLNPFRAAHPADGSALSPDHIAVTRPDLVRDVGEYKWLDPAEPEAREHSLAVVADVLERYDVDGVHLDDYFYPYPSEETPFPDAAGYERFVGAGGEADLKAWRRTHINSFVKELSKMVRRHSPSARIGISPFGIWRPGNPEGVVGFDAYDGLAADAKLWVQAGWLDYVSPQLYWPIESPGQPFEPLLNWWRHTDTRERGVWPGLYLTRIKADGGWAPDAIERQILAARQQKAGGFILFSMVGLTENRQGVADILGESVLSEPAIVPEPWFGPGEPVRGATRPRLRLLETPTGYRAAWTPATSTGDPFRWILSVRTGLGWSSVSLPGRDRSFSIPASPEDPIAHPDAVTITPVYRYGQVGDSAASARVMP